MEERKSRYELFLEEEARTAQPTKRCTKCGEVKALGEFDIERRVKSGVTAQCRECNRKRHPRKYRDDADRFWKKYHAETKKEGECLIWTGYCDRNGYAVIDWRGKGTTVARIVYQLAIGPVTDDMFVFHSCNNKRCVRHGHLVLGGKNDLQVKLANNAPTGRLNGMYTCPEKRRVGEKHHSAKLNAGQVRTARQLYELGVPIKDIASRFSVAESTMSLVVRRKTWAHVE